MLYYKHEQKQFSRTPNISLAVVQFSSRLGVQTLVWQSSKLKSTQKFFRTENFLRRLDSCQTKFLRQKTGATIGFLPNVSLDDCQTLVWTTAKLKF